MQIKLLRWLTTVLSLLFILTSWAGTNSSIEGKWVVINKDTHKPAAIIEFYKKVGKFYGRIKHVYSQSKNDQNKKDRLARQKVEGLTIIEGLKRVHGAYRLGSIMDPRNGSVYRFQAKLLRSGNSLRVRGYLVVPFLGRSDTWYRYQSFRGL